MSPTIGPDLVRHNAPTTVETKIDGGAWLAGERRPIGAELWSPPKVRVSTGRDGRADGGAGGYRNPVRIRDLGDGFTMILGPNQVALFLEVGSVQGEHVHVIVHAMLAREKSLR